MKRIALLTSLLLFMAFQASAQDVITKRDGTNMEVSIASKNGTRLFYHMYGDPQGQLYAMDMSEVAIIVYEGGYTEKYITKKEEAIMNGTYVAKTDDGMKHHHLYAGAGAGFIVSKMSFADGLTVTGGNIRNGLVYGAGYEYVMDSGLMIGAFYNAYTSSCEGRVEGENLTFGVSLPVFGPTLGFMTNSGNWSFIERLGVGYALDKEVLSDGDIDVSGSESGFGWQATLGAEYRLSPSVAVGLNLNAMSALFSEEIGGFRIIAINAGLRIDL